MRAAGERKLNGEHAPYQSHSATSRAAAEAIKPRLNALQARVYAYIKATGGCTDEEIIDAAKMSPSTIRPRRIELVDMGLVEDSGSTKHTRSGRSATIWRVCK